MVVLGSSQRQRRGGLRVPRPRGEGLPTAPDPPPCPVLPSARCFTTHGEVPGNSRLGGPSRLRPLHARHPTACAALSHSIPRAILGTLVSNRFFTLLLLAKSCHGSCFSTDGFAISSCIRMEFVGLNSKGTKLKISSNDSNSSQLTTPLIIKRGVLPLDKGFAKRNSPRRLGTGCAGERLAPRCEAAGRFLLL